MAWPSTEMSTPRTRPRTSESAFGLDLGLQGGGAGVRKASEKPIAPPPSAKLSVLEAPIAAEPDFLHSRGYQSNKLSMDVYFKGDSCFSQAALHGFCV